MLLVRTAFILSGILLFTSLITASASLFFKIVTDISSKSSYSELVCLVCILYVGFKIYTVLHLKFIEKFIDKPENKKEDDEEGEE